MRNKNRGFTLGEILVVVGLIVLLTTVIIASVQKSREKSADLDVKNELSNVQVDVEKYDIAPGVVDYTAAFPAKNIPDKLSALATKYGVEAGEYEYATTTTEYVVVFPLKRTDAFYCVDSTGVSKEVIGLLETLGPRSCASATRVPTGPAPEVDNPATRTLTAIPNPGLPIPSYSNGTTGFYESLPRGYYNATNSNKKWPLLIFLHGMGERGDGSTQLSRVLRHGAPKEINNGAQLEYTVNGTLQTFVVIAPQLPSGMSSWHPFYVEDTINYALAHYNIDPAKIYLTGLSLGGFGSVFYPSFSPAYSDAYSKRIAAIVASDGAWGNVGTTATLYTPGYAPNGGMAPLDLCYVSAQSIPMWLFYGNNSSPSHPAWNTYSADTYIRTCIPAPNPNALMTQYSDVGTAWAKAFASDHTYNNPNIYEWLLQQTN